MIDDDFISETLAIANCSDSMRFYLASLFADRLSHLNDGFDREQFIGEVCSGKHLSPAGRES